MNLLTTSIESIRLTRWNIGPGALTLVGVFAIALALILPDSITPYLALASPPLAKSDTFVNLL
jgi:hypothetical protein